jgi:hypothetical protein
MFTIISFGSFVGLRCVNRMDVFAAKVEYLRDVLIQVVLLFMPVIFQHSVGDYLKCNN